MKREAAQNESLEPDREVLPGHGAGASGPERLAEEAQGDQHPLTRARGLPPKSESKEVEKGPRLLKRRNT